MYRVPGLALLLLLPLGAQPANDRLQGCSAAGAADSLPADRIRVLSLNISHGRNTALNQLLVSKRKTYENLDRISALFVDKNPDIVALQEADGPSRWSGNFDHVAYLGDRAGFECRLHGLHSRAWISSYGTALLSDAQPREYASVTFTPSWPSKRKGYVWASFDWTVDGQNLPVTVVSVHLDFLRDSVRDRQIDELSGELAKVGGPLIVMGDLNSEWDDPASQVQRLAVELELQAYAPFSERMGTYKKPGGKRLDWILISKQLEFIDSSVLTDIVSDHLAVYAEIGHRGEAE